MTTWKEDIIQALKNLGGRAHLSKIQNEVARLRKGKLNNSWIYSIQENLQRHSSDSDYGRGKYGSGEDIFYMPEGKRKGVWGLRNFKGIGLREIFFKLGTQYQKEKKKTDKGTKPIYIPPGNEFARWITRDIPKIIEELYEKEIEGLEVHTSAGQSSWVTSPWIVILDPKTCTQPNGRVSVQGGFYPGYSFSKDEKKISFFLGQGEYNVRLNYPQDVDHMLITRAIILRKKVPEYEKFFMDVSKSSLLKESIMKDRWVKSSAFGKVYKTHNLPSEEELKKDLINMVRLYKLAIERGGVSETKKQNISFDQDQLSAGFERKVLKHINNENEIIQIDPKFIKQLKKDSDYTCQACGLKYEKVYGDYSKKKDFIEAHHIEPKFKAKEKAEINKKMKRSAKDFAMLCANCHRMIHRMMKLEKDRVISLEEFKRRINSDFKGYIKKL